MNTKYRTVQLFSHKGVWYVKILSRWLCCIRSLNEGTRLWEIGVLIRIGQLSVWYLDTSQMLGSWHNQCQGWTDNRRKAKTQCTHYEFIEKPETVHYRNTNNHRINMKTKLIKEVHGSALFILIFLVLYIVRIIFNTGCFTNLKEICCQNGTRALGIC